MQPQNNSIYWINALAVMVSCICSITASYIFIYRANKRAKQSDVERELAVRAFAVNELFSKSNIQSPYAYHLQIKPEFYQPFNAKTAAFLNQLNLLHIVFSSKDILGKQNVKRHQEWARFMLSGWIRNDPELQKIWEFYKAKDLGGDFVKWAAVLIDNPTGVKITAQGQTMPLR